MREQVATQEDIKVLAQELHTSTRMPLAKTSYRANLQSRDGEVHSALWELMQRYGCRKGVGSETDESIYNTALLLIPVFIAVKSLFSTEIRLASEFFSSWYSMKLCQIGSLIE